MMIYTIYLQYIFIIYMYINIYITAKIIQKQNMKSSPGVSVISFCFALHLFPVVGLTFGSPTALNLLSTGDMHSMKF